MVVLIVTLYSFMALRYVVLYYNVSGDLISLTDTLNELRLQEDSSLGWLNINAGMFTTLVGTTAAMFLSYLASIYFFFFTRHQDAR